MTRDEFTKNLKLLTDLIPTLKNMTDQKVKLWWDVMQNENAFLFHDAITDWARETNRQPTIEDLKARMIDIRYRKKAFDSVERSQCQVCNSDGILCVEKISDVYGSIENIYRCGHCRQSESNIQFAIIKNNQVYVIQGSIVKEKIGDVLIPVYYAQWESPLILIENASLCDKHHSKEVNMNQSISHDTQSALKNLRKIICLNTRKPESMFPIPSE